MSRQRKGKAGTAIAQTQKDRLAGELPQPIVRLEQQRPLVGHEIPMAPQWHEQGLG